MGDNELLVYTGIRAHRLNRLQQPKLNIGCMQRWFDGFVQNQFMVQGQPDFAARLWELMSTRHIAQRGLGATQVAQAMWVVTVPTGVRLPPLNHPLGNHNIRKK